MKNSTILYIFGIAVIMLVIGTALGSVVFPTTETETTTMASITTTTSSANNFTEIVPITLVTTTTLSITTVSVTFSSLLFSGDNLLQTPYISSNSSVTLNCNSSHFFFKLATGRILNLTLNGNSNTALVDGGQLSLAINGNSNNLTTFTNTIILSKQVNGTGNNVSSIPLPPT
jgi:hypothetical protein